MDSKALQECAQQFAAALPFTEHCWPFGPEHDVFKVCGKIFMMTTTAHGRPMVTLKSDPQTSLLNQQIYPSIEPGYHMNKRHWISVYAGDDINQSLLTSLIQSSWDRVVDGLPRKDQRRLRPS
ncbi:MmcQ/YjbR family DNA-binding protein [Salmonella enterica]